MANKKKKKNIPDYSRAIVAVITDVHANSTAALCPPVVRRDRADDWRQTKPQRWIYETAWMPYVEELWDVKKRLKWPFYLISGGELADDNKYSETELISKNPADQLRMPVELLKPLIDMADFFIAVRGTEAHTGPASWMDEKVAEDITITVRNEEGEASWYQFRASLGGVQIHIQHHPGTGAYKPWTQGADANRLAADMIYRYIAHNKAMKRQGTPELQQEIPDVVFCGHNHTPSDSIDNHPVRALILPSWQLTTGFGHRLSGKWLPVGGTYMLCDRGQFDIFKRYKHWPIGHPWVPQLEEHEHGRAQ